MTKCHFTPGSEYWPLIGWCRLATDLWLVDNSRCSHPGSELDHQRVWSLCRGHHRHLGRLLGHLLGQSETGGMKTNMNRYLSTPSVHGWKESCLMIQKLSQKWVKGRCFSQFPQFHTMNPLFGCCSAADSLLVAANCKMSELNTIGCGPKVNVGLLSLVLGADPAMISNWNRSILNSAIDWVITYRKDCTSSCQLYSLINKIRFGAFYQCLWFLALTTLLNFVIIAYDLY